MSGRVLSWLISAALATLIAGPALAATPERDQAWDSLISEAKKHGGEETQYKTSVSYVFRNPDGEYVTFTRMLDSSTRAVCVLTKDQTLTVCGNWDTSKLRYGWRANADWPWTYSDTPPSEQKSSGFGSLLMKLGDIMSLGMKTSKRASGQ